MSAPRYRNKADDSIVEAIQFVFDDPRTHWHVNFGHKSIELLQGIYWVTTVDGVEEIEDRDWVVKDSAGLRRLSHEAFVDAYAALPPDEVT